MSACLCVKWCGDSDPDGPGVCKGLPVKREPLVEIVMVPRGMPSEDT
jgi:hypothetical protein